LSPKNIKHLSLTSGYLLTLSLGFDKSDEKLIQSLYPQLFSEYESLCLTYQTNKGWLYNQNFNLMKAIKSYQLGPLLVLKVFFKAILEHFPSHSDANCMIKYGAVTEDPEEIE
jgi:hypothetical protein